VLIGPPFVPAAEQDTWLLESVAFAEACGASVISLIPAQPKRRDERSRPKLFHAPTHEDVDEACGW
jgi:hypothetical protein